MKALICEMCGSNDIVKQDGLYVCQMCRTKYSVEEARKMMVEGIVEVVGTVKIDNTAQIQNYLDLSENAYESGNGQCAFDYANKALEIMPQNSKAWIAKMKSLEFLGTFGSLKLMEVIEAGKNAINYASEDAKEDISYEVYRYELVRALSILKLAINKMKDTAEIRETFKRFALISVLSAGNNTLKVDSKIVNLYDNVANEAQAMVLLVPDDILGKHADLAKMVGECAKQYQYETDAIIERYNIYGAKLLDSAKQARENNRKNMQAKCDRTIKLAQEYEAKLKAEKKVAYWKEHADEKATLDSEIAMLELELASVKTQIKTLEDERESLPSKQGYNEIDRKIDELRKRQGSLGLFRGKEKKLIQEEISKLTLERDSARRIWETDKEEVGSRMKPLYTKKKEIDDRINEIEREFTKDR